MARKTHVYRTPWAEAARYFSSEADLWRSARTKETRRNWRKLGVPADVLLPQVLNYFGVGVRLARRLPPKDGEPRGVREVVEIAKRDPIVLEVFRNLRDIQARDPDLFGHVRAWIQAMHERVIRTKSQPRRRREGAQ